MREPLKILVIGVLLILGWISVHSPRPQPEPAALTAGNAAPDFTWQDFAGTSHRLSELSGHTVALHFWASWCAPCRAEFPALLSAAKRAGGNVIFLTISSDSERSKAQRFIEQAQHEAGLPAPANVLYGFDPQKKLTFDLFQTIQYPETIIMDSAHRLRRKFPGPVEWNSPDIRQYLEALKPQ